MTGRKYNLTFAELCDRLSIIILKSIFIPENKKAYKEEQELIMYDIDEILMDRDDVKHGGRDNTNPVISAKMIRAIMIVMLTNRAIWESEAKARAGSPEQDKLLKFTHSINGVRNTAKNILSQELGERVDLKIDCLAAELIKEFGNWNIFKED